MSNTSNTISRRKFLKASAYASALTVGGMSGLAVADTLSINQATSNGLGMTSVTLQNQSNKAIVLDAAQPVSLEKVHGWVVVKVNKANSLDASAATTKEKLTLAAGQQLSFPVNSELAPALKESGGHIVITSDYSELDNMVPMATYDVVVV